MSMSITRRVKSGCFFGAISRILRYGCLLCSARRMLAAVMISSVYFICDIIKVKICDYSFAYLLSGYIRTKRLTGYSVIRQQL